MTYAKPTNAFLAVNDFLHGWIVYIRAARAEAKSRRSAGSVSRALKELSTFSEYELNDIGLTRSDLTPEGLAAAGARRSLLQEQMDAERVTSAAGMKG